MSLSGPQQSRLEGEDGRYHYRVIASRPNTETNTGKARYLSLSHTRDMAGSGGRGGCRPSARVHLDLQSGTYRRQNRLGLTRNPTELNMTEVIRAVFAAASAAGAAIHDLQVARIPSATISRVNTRESEQGHLRPLVTVAVDNMHADAITGILNLHGPLGIKKRAA